MGGLGEQLKVSFRGDEDVLRSLVVTAAQLCEDPKTTQSYTFNG